MSLVGMAESHRKNALQGYGSLAGLERSAQDQNTALQGQADARKDNQVGNAIGTGLSVGMMTGNPYIGAAAAAASLFGIF